MKPEQLEVVAGILGRQDVMQYFITDAFLKKKSLMLASPDHFLRANGHVTYG